MPITRLLIADRGEIAIRIGRAAADLGLRSVAVHSRDDARSLHVRATDGVRELPGQGAAAYLDADAVIAAAKTSGCDAVHPGYGFLSERADFARRCAKAGLIFVRTTPEHLELFGESSAGSGGGSLLTSCSRAPPINARQRQNGRRSSGWSGGSPLPTMRQWGRRGDRAASLTRLVTNACDEGQSTWRCP